VSGTRLCLVGLPGAGKTTFLAAFWAAVRDSSEVGSYKITRWPKDARYLQKIADEWFEGKVVERNPSSSMEPIELDVQSTAGTAFSLRVPDLSGEAFRDAAADRQIDPRVAALVAECELVLFFLSAATATVPISLADLAIDDEEEAEPDEEVADFDPDELETDVLNGELLQLLPALTPTPEAPPPMAVIVSAWDTVDRVGLTPTEWLDKEQPMFGQLLSEYRRNAPVAVIGISAQGADYDKDPTVARKPPAERPLVVTDHTRSTDITAPLAWFDDQLRDGHGG
jgi:energy-coupling factor transporter ATP-binding protein EcfA2